MTDYATNDPRELIGKTIVGSEPIDAAWSSNFRLHFSDGTSADFEAQGYEADGVGIRLDSYTGRMRRGCIAAGEREARRVQDLAMQVRRIRARELRDRMKAELSPEAFEQWKREQDPQYILKTLYTSEIEKALYSQSPLLNRQFYGGATPDAD